MPKSKLFRFFPWYVGSKASWVNFLEPMFKGSPFVELFAGSGALTANLGQKNSILIDLDPHICWILSHYDQLIVPETFTKEDYLEKRKSPDWQRYILVLSRLAFSGVFRYSKNGWNVPYRESKKPINLEEIKKEYQRNLQRWRELEPIVINSDYRSAAVDFEKKVVVADPPYAGSQVAYLSKKFDFDAYWKLIKEELPKKAEGIILFDTYQNLSQQGIPILGTRTMCVNGAKERGKEALAIFKNGEWLKC